MTITQPIALVVGARPNFMKATPLVRVLKERGVPHHVIHTGQHYDVNMAEQFFDDFGLRPDTIFSLKATTPTSQLAEIVLRLERAFTATKPRLVVVFGDVTSTLAGALTANKMGIPVAHVEAGLRSYNKLMPEEMHRRLTDHIADFLFAPSEEDAERLLEEKVAGQVHVVGNIMLDLLQHAANEAEEREGDYYYVTLHRAENVDRRDVFDAILTALEHVSADAKMFLPLHPRTEKMAKEHGLFERLEKAVHLLPPLSYRDAVSYMKHAELVLTDSGGVQEETTYLGVPCLTLRTETERPITVSQGTNTIVGTTTESILDAYRAAKPFKKKETSIPLWDGNTAVRIADILMEHV